MTVQESFSALDEILAASATALLLMKSGKYKRLPEMKAALQEDYPKMSEKQIDQAIGELGRHLIRNDFQGIRALRKRRIVSQTHHK